MKLDKSRYSSLLADLDNNKDKYPDTVHDAYVKASTYKVVTYNKYKGSNIITNASVFKVNQKNKKGTRASTSCENLW
jgi:hypothetical protein